MASLFSVDILQLVTPSVRYGFLSSQPAILIYVGELF